MDYYKITKAEADLLTKFSYAKEEAFNPYCSEQKDGCFIVSDLMLKKLNKF